MAQLKSMDGGTINTSRLLKNALTRKLSTAEIVIPLFVKKKKLPQYAWHWPQLFLKYPKSFAKEWFSIAGPWECKKNATKYQDDHQY